MESITPIECHVKNGVLRFTKCFIYAILSVVSACLTTSCVLFKPSSDESINVVCFEQSEIDRRISLMDDYLSSAGYVKIYGGLFIYEKDPAALLRPFASDKQSAPGRVRLQIKLVEEASGHIRAILRWSWVYAKPSGGEEQELFPVEGTEFLKDLQAIRQILDGKSASTYPIAH